MNEQTTTKQALTGFATDIPLGELRPFAYQAIKLLGFELDETNCESPRTCGRIKGMSYHNQGYEDSYNVYCHLHTCPISRAHTAFQGLRPVQNWPKVHWQSVANGRRYNHLVRVFHELNIEYLGIPQESGLVIVLTPEPVVESVEYTGGWLGLYLLFYDMPPHSRTRHQLQRAERVMEDNVMAAEEPITRAVAIAQAKQERQENGLRGIPLVPRYVTYSLRYWTLEERIYLFTEAGLDLVVNERGNLRIEGAIERLVEVLEDLSHPTDEFLQYIQKIVLQELALAERPEKYQILDSLRWNEVRRARRASYGTIRAAS